MKDDKSPYEILKISKHTEKSEIKKTYFELIKKYNPEKESDKFKEIRTAYEKLRDPKSRIEVDIFHFNDPFGEFKFTEKDDDYDLNIYIDDLLTALEENLVNLT